MDIEKADRELYASIYMMSLFDSMDSRQAHGTEDFDIRYHILRNPNWTKE